MDRKQLIFTLLDDEERANAEYIAGQMDRDTWTKNLAEIDDKLSILGIRLSFRPWENTNPGSPRF